MELKNLIVMLMFLLVVVFAVSTAQAVTVITTAEELQAMADDLNGDYVLGNDIDLTGFDWQRVGPFAGTFSGANHIISGLTMDADRANLFGVLAASGVVKNVGLTNVNIRAPWYGAALVGDCYGTVSKCYVKGGTVTCVGVDGRAGNFGAVIGMTRPGGIVTDCYASDLVVTFATDLEYWNSQAGFIGGQHGGADGLVANCYFAGTIIGFSIGPTWRHGGGFLDHTNDNSVTTSCYYDVNLAGFDDGMGMGRTTAEMMTQSTFVGWDFDNTWTMIEGQTYPTLIPEPATTLYVDDDASPDGDGLSWGTAFKYLQDGLAAASYGDEIRIAQGIYKPDQDEAGSVTPGNREETFQLINGVALKGGYAGLGELDPNKRDIKTYESILSGDLAGDDGPDFANNGENSYHVVNSSNTDETTIFDGFTITAGNANGSSYPDKYDYGGGIYNYGADPTLTNCTFIGNSAEHRGGGMCDIFSNNPTLINCTFIGNSAEKGGGIDHHSFQYLTLTNCTFSNNSANKGGAAYLEHGDITLTNCTFRENSANNNGGAIENFENTPTLTNCIFSDNSAGNDGGAIMSTYVFQTLTNCMFSMNLANRGGGMYNEGHELALTNCTFATNSATYGMALAFDSWNSHYPTDVSITNCIIWDSEYGIWNSDESTITMNYSDMQGGWWGDGSNNIDADPCFVTGRLGDYYLSHTAAGQAIDSPCVDAGSDTAANLGVDIFTTRTDQVIDAGTVDMGYHYPITNVADIDGDWDVDFVDFAILASQWRQAPGIPSADIEPASGNGIVNFLDLAVLVDNWLWRQ